MLYQYQTWLQNDEGVKKINVAQVSLAFPVEMLSVPIRLSLYKR